MDLSADAMNAARFSFLLTMSDHVFGELVHEVDVIAVMRLDLERMRINVGKCEVQVGKIACLDAIGPDAVAASITSVPRLIVGDVRTTGRAAAALSTTWGWHDCAIAEVFLTWCVVALFIFVTAMR
ncbi:hypothetical protein K458DRAFT_400469 [Lentithecium fluviatile CBS 122367]|uniref:Uncharacterized protein n=1 Tax=Lentithecium fluviatile CBS 122367 TaxID=1168545 RepID=A0A6G1JHY4_9PLEO|nr:hypothetical protein K458DRAFT_400469 [Lentithecium fluviatile CBS 122367]